MAVLGEVQSKAEQVLPNRRGKCMSRRFGQSGCIVKKGNMYHGRYYEDVPGHDARVHRSIPLGLVTEMTKSEARRALILKLGELGVNTVTHLERASHGATMFTAEAGWWRDNRLSLCKPSFRNTVGCHLDKYILPFFGAFPLDLVTERKVQEFIASLSQATYISPAGVSRPLAPKSIRNIVGVVKQILGERVWRDWRLTLPEIPVKPQRFFTIDEMRQLVQTSSGQWRVLFTLLAGTGMRPSEACGLHVEDLDLAVGRVFIRRGMYGQDEQTPKTKRGFRVVCIDAPLVECLREFLGGRTTGRVFSTRRGTALTHALIRRRVQALIKRLGLPAGSTYAFRHGRVSVLQSAGVPGDLVKEWVGHSSLEMTSRYTHFVDSYRQQVAASVGTGVA